MNPLDPNKPLLSQKNKRLVYHLEKIYLVNKVYNFKTYLKCKLTRCSGRAIESFDQIRLTKTHSLFCDDLSPRKQKSMQVNQNISNEV